METKQYSLALKEMHLRKESHGRTLGFCIGPKERHDYIWSSQSIDPNESHVLQVNKVLIVFRTQNFTNIIYTFEYWS